jgi:hypothetical protein
MLQKPQTRILRECGLLVYTWLFSYAIAAPR